MVQNGPNDLFGQNDLIPLEPDFSSRETKMDQNGPRTLAIPEQMCTLVDDCAQIADSGLKPPFVSPRLDFPEFLGTLSGTLPGILLARRARETPVAGRGVRNNCRFCCRNRPNQGAT